MQLKSVAFGLIALASLACALPTPGTFTNPYVEYEDGPSSEMDSGSADFKLAMAKRDEADTASTADYEPQVSYWTDAYPASEEELASTS